MGAGLLGIEWSTWFTSQLGSVISGSPPVDDAPRRRHNDIAAVTAEIDSGSSGLPGALLDVSICWEVEVEPAGRSPDRGFPSFKQPSTPGAIECVVTVDGAVHVDINHNKARGSASRHPDIR